MHPGDVDSRTQPSDRKLESPVASKKTARQRPPTVCHILLELGREPGTHPFGDPNHVYHLYLPLLPDGFRMMPQADGDLGQRLIRMTRELFIAGHRGVVLVNADSPTLPHSILRDAIAMTGHTDNVVIAPAHDGGYTLIGLTQPHDALFTDIDWSTSRVFGQTRARALQLRLPVVELPLWYDVDDAEYAALIATLQKMLKNIRKHDI